MAVSATKQFVTDINEDIVMDIIVRLPTKSILRCTSVCKSWNSLIKSPHFAAAYRAHPKKTKYLLCKFDPEISDDDSDSELCFDVTDDSEIRNDVFYSIHYDNKAFREYYRLGFPKKKDPNFVRNLLGCCNGLLCFSEMNGWYRDFTIYLWNPAIRRLKILPEFEYNKKDFCKFGFGFYSENNDYKVMKNGSVVEVYSLSTDSWKRINNCVAPNVIFLQEIAVVNRKIYWMVLRDYWKNIVCFDLDNEMFKEMKLPQFLVNDTEKLSFCLGEMRDSSLVLLDRFEKLNGNIWVYNIHAESWNKVLIIDMDHPCWFPLGFRNNGEVLLGIDLFSNIGMVSHNFETRKNKKLRISLHLLPSEVEPFVETLALLCDGDAVEVSPVF